jgi:hypothetical protein
MFGKVVYYLPFEKNIEDSSVNKISFHQTVGSNLNYEEGPMGQSLVLNNTVLLSENDVFNMYSTHTLAAWIKTDNKNGNNQVFVHQKNDPDLNAGRVHIEMLSSNTISSFTGGVESERTSRPGGVTEGTWYHVASVFDKENKNKLLYIDGELIDSKTLTSTEQCKSEFVIGAFKNEASAFVNGGIDELVLFKKALNETEINNIMKYGVANISTSINKSPKVALAPKINIVNGNAINELIFEYNSGLASNYSIYDMTGKINHKGVSYSGQSVFLNILDPGTYIVQVEVDSQLASKKVFVE